MRIKRKVISLKDLKKSLYLRPDDVFVWTVKRGWKCRGIGEPAGSVHPKYGYLIITLHGVPYRAHRLVWLWHTGKMPKHDLDHRDGDRLNNRIENLRECTMVENGCNRGIQANNSTGYKGVRYHHRDNVFESFIVVRQKQIYLGRFGDAVSAARAYDDAAIEHQGEFACLNLPRTP